MQLIIQFFSSPIKFMKFNVKYIDNCIIIIGHERAQHKHSAGLQTGNNFLTLIAGGSLSDIRSSFTACGK